MFIFGIQNLKNHNFFKKFEQSKSSQILFPVKKIFRKVLQIAYEWSHEQQAKIVVNNFFLQFQQFYFPIWLPKCLCETQLAEFFEFLDSKKRQ